jgi:magnesium transporter
MASLIKKRSVKRGMSPGSLVHVGEKKVHKATIRVMDYSPQDVKEYIAESIEECYGKEGPGVKWVDVTGLHQTDILQKLGDHYNVHPLVLEDILNTDQRPKMEDYGDYIYVVLRSLEYNDETERVEYDQISIVLTAKIVFSFQEKEGDPFDSIRDRIRSGKGRLRNSGADYLAYGLLDSIVDSYFLVLEKTGDEIESLEDRIVSDPSDETLRMIHEVKRELLFLRKAVWPLRECISNLERADSALIQKNTRLFLRDLNDHTVQVIDTLEIFRDMMAGILDIYLSSVSNRMNSVMKVLTIIATIFMPLTFLAGIYGMNFKHMPELDQPWGYPFALCLMVMVGLLMLYYFRKKKWL